ncbi:2OG-Fe(II) oxygenase [Phenylobacterium hankyongense]|nr:2OG-Fe(II) oxygenase [Phenylobacterium hankyongense]
MPFLDLDAIEAAPMQHEPFDYFVVSGAVPLCFADQIESDYPKIEASGSFPLGQLQIGPSVRALIAEFEGPAFRQLVARKLGVELEGKPTVVTLRGRCAERDGKIHTDSKSKIVSLLLYLNGVTWDSTGGRLRMLRQGDDLDAVATEISPTFGNLVVFRRSERSWHGHASYAGPRRVLQINFVRAQHTTLVSGLRHGLSSATKRMKKLMSARG